jgi:hypothetical protein
MDGLAPLCCVFPELNEVIRTNHLSLRLATSPLVLSSWLRILRKVGISLELYPYVLSEVYESLGSTFSVATFSDGGPPMIGDSQWIHDTCDTTDCGQGDYCDCYPKCGSSPPARVFDIPSDFDASAYLSIDDKERFSSVTLVLEFPPGNDSNCTRYMTGIHGRVLHVEDSDTVKLSDDTTVEVSDNDISSQSSETTLREYLEVHDSMSFDDDSVPESSIFDPIDEDDYPGSELTSVSSDGDTTVEVAWKRRPVRA